MTPDTWFFPGKTAMALTAHFPPSTPLACVGGNNAPKPGVVGIDALVGAYAQTGRLCPDGHRHHARDRARAGVRRKDAG